MNTPFHHGNDRKFDTTQFRSNANSCSIIEYQFLYKGLNFLKFCK